MEDEDSRCLNSPTIQKNTPIKRLGLSRKRKNSGIDGNLLHKVFMSNGNSLLSSYQSENINTSHKNEKRKEEPNNENKVHQKKELNNDENFGENVDIMNEMVLIKKRVEEKKERLKYLKNNMKNILELEKLIEMWKNGCRKAYLHLEELIKEKNVENIDSRAILKRLGILVTMIKHFGNDGEICISDD